MFHVVQTATKLVKSWGFSPSFPWSPPVTSNRFYLSTNSKRLYSHAYIGFRFINLLRRHLTLGRQSIKGQICNDSHIFIIHLILSFNPLAKFQKTQVLTGLIRQPTQVRFPNCKRGAYMPIPFWQCLETGGPRSPGWFTSTQEFKGKGIVFLLRLGKISQVVALVISEH